MDAENLSASHSFVISLKLKVLFRTFLLFAVYFPLLHSKQSAIRDSSTFQNIFPLNEEIVIEKASFT